MCLFDEVEYKEVFGDEKHTTGFKVVLSGGDGLKSLARKKPINRFGDTVAESSDPKKSIYFLSPGEDNEKFLLRALRNHQLLIKIKPVGRQWHELPKGADSDDFYFHCGIQICTCEQYTIIEEIKK